MLCSVQGERVKKAITFRLLRRILFLATYIRSINLFISFGLVLCIARSLFSLSLSTSFNLYQRALKNYYLLKKNLFLQQRKKNLTRIQIAPHANLSRTLYLGEWMDGWMNSNVNTRNWKHSLRTPKNKTESERQRKRQNTLEKNRKQRTNNSMSLSLFCLCLSTLLLLSFFFSVCLFVC